MKCEDRNASVGPPGRGRLRLEPGLRLAQTGGPIDRLYYLPLLLDNRIIIQLSKCNFMILNDGHITKE